MSEVVSALDAYKASGVDPRRADRALKGLVKELRSTLKIRSDTKLEIGYFANVIDLGSTWIAISTDGVGSKSLIAQWMGVYDTIGIDCVASNVNDVLCTGAEPLSLVDYLAVHSIDESKIAEIGKGLAEGARQAKITISGGEIAELPDGIQQHGPGMGFDLAGACIGALEPGTAVMGERIQAGDVIIGLFSSGIHCNGVSLARRAFEINPEHLDNLHRQIPGLNVSVGEELLKPTLIYVDPIMSMKSAGIDLRGLVHMTGGSGGFLKLPRLHSDFGYVIDSLPDPPPVFRLIQERARMPDEEMYEVFNMGIGFCVIVPPDDAARALDIAHQHCSAERIGYVAEIPNQEVRLPSVGLEGRMGEGFHKI